jgi:hypothetical protein
MSKVEVTIRYAVLNKNYDIVGQMENFVKVKVNTAWVEHLTSKLR